MFLACFLAVFAISVILSIHTFNEVLVGGWGICTCWWLYILVSFGRVCQFGSFFCNVYSFYD